MNPGRELDALIAEKVMGWKQDKNEDCYWWIGDECVYLPNIKPFSTDIAAAWEVVEHTKLFDSHGRVLCRIENQWAIVFGQQSGGWGDLSGVVLAHTAPHAICLAALKAVEK